MDQTQPPQEDRHALIIRLLCCIGAALALYAALDPVCLTLRLDALDRLHPWMKENKMQTVAILAGVLFGLSLAAFPLDAPEDGCDPAFTL